MYTNPVSTLLVYLHIAVSCVGMLSRVRYILSGRVLTPKVKILTNARHIGRAVRFVDFIARFSTDLVYFSYRSSHLSLPIFGTAKSCL